MSATRIESGVMDSRLGECRFGVASFCCLGIGVIMLVGFVASGMNADPQLRYLKLAMLLILVPGPVAMLLGVAGAIWDRNKKPALFALPLGALTTIALALMGG